MAHKRHVREPTADCSFPAVVLKGVIERGDRNAYFGSLGGLQDYVSLAVRFGWVKHVSTDEDGVQTWVATELGQRVYETSGLRELPRKGRGYMWDWSKVRLEE